MAPKKGQSEDSDEEFDIFLTEKEKKANRYNTKRLHDEQASKDKRSRSGNQSTEYEDDDNEWS